MYVWGGGMKRIWAGNTVILIWWGAHTSREKAERGQVGKLPKSGNLQDLWAPGVTGLIDYHWEKPPSKTRRGQDSLLRSLLFTCLHWWIRLLCSRFLPSTADWCNLLSPFFLFFFRKSRTLWLSLELQLLSKWRAAFPTQDSQCTRSLIQILTNNY